MGAVVECRVEPTSILELLPVRVARDGDTFLVGHHRGRTYLALTPNALEATTLLGEQVPVGRVKEILAEKYRTGHVILAPLLEQLLSAGLVRAIDGEPVAGQRRLEVSRPPWLTADRVAPLFSTTAGIVYAAVVAGGLIALADPLTWPRLDVITAGRSYATLLLSVGLMLANAVKHEAAHVAAARFLGVEASWRLGHRLWFPVIEIDLSGLWMVEPRKRYLAYCAGMVSDLLAASLALMAMWLHAHGYVEFSGGVVQALSLTVVIVAVGVAWQSNVFLRTDGYYMLATALGCRNLAADAKTYLRRRHGVYPRHVRLYAAGYVVVVVVLGGLWITGAVMILGGGGAGSATARAALAVSAAALLVGIAAERRRTPPRFRLVCPAGLALLLGLLS